MPLTHPDVVPRRSAPALVDGITDDIFRLSRQVDQVASDDAESLDLLASVFNVAGGDKTEAGAFFGAFAHAAATALDAFHAKTQSLMTELAERHARAKELHDEIAAITGNLRSMMAVLGPAASSALALGAQPSAPPANVAGPSAAVPPVPPAEPAGKPLGEGLTTLEFALSF